jgi:hypothetical protein
MKKDNPRDRKRSDLEREPRIKKVHSQKESGKKWRKFLEEELDDDE